MSASPELRPVTPLGVLSEQLEQLVATARAQNLGDGAFAAGLERAYELARGLEPYLAANTSAASPALDALAAATRAADWTPPRNACERDRALEPEMLSGHVEGQFLQTLVAATGARAVLEIGLFTGYSALAMAEALPAGGRLLACEIDPRAADFAARRLAAAPCGERIEIRPGPARATLADLAAAGERFDLVFIDADKSSYADYLRQVIDAPLLAERGLVCVDNTLLQGQPWLSGPPSDNGAAIAAFNAAVAADPGLHRVLLPLRDGLTLIRRAHG